jgi:hypothetical protein
MFVFTSAFLFPLLPAHSQSNPLLAPTDSKPLPGLDSFIQDIRRHLHTDSILQSQYTFIEKSISRQADSSGKVRRTETRIYEVYPSADEELAYRKLISKNDSIPSDAEIKKKENEYDKGRQEQLERQRQLEKENPDQKRRREAREKEAKRKEQESEDEAFRLYEITMIGREQMEGIPVIGLKIEPRSGYKSKTEDGKLMLKLHGKAWFGEEDKELVRLDVELIDSISFGWGIIGKLNKGSRLFFQRRKLNNEVWLPASAHFVGTGRFLLFKTFRIDQETTYSDYHKFSVETDFKLDSLKNP